MSARIDKVTVTIDFDVEFEGPGTATFELPPDDPLVDLLRERHEAMLLAAARAAGPTDIMLG